MFGLLFLFPLVPVLSAEEPPLGEMRHYRSAIDGSRQAYGVYLPRANPPTTAGYPLVMHAHGYGWYAGADFSVWQRRFADDHGWVLVNVNGRGPNFYDGIGEDDVLRVLEDVAKLVAVDRTRVYMTGGSMGGTGAYRMGVRRPDIFPAVAPVDGWTDYREFHRHWYERKDMPGSIEEFRRPLLEAVSPYYLAPTARWGAVQLIVDGRDDIVLPENGLRLYDALQAENNGARELYRNELVYYGDRGHGAGYDLPLIYDYFLGLAAIERPPSVAIQTPLLRYGRVHWAAIDRFAVQGGLGRLEAEVREDGVYVTTRNLAAFTLYLTDSPLADRERLSVIVEGSPRYDGPPCEVSFRVTEAGGWARWEPDDGLRKRRGLEGPIGEAFLAPFVVAWGTAGDGEAVREARTEAEDFAREWNDFNVHYAAVRARPEDDLTEDERRAGNLILFGTLDSCALLKQMAAAADLPVLVYEDRVIVRDPEGDRVYRGRKYGSYWVYPNPLTDSRTLVVGCKGRFATRADGGVPRGLGYDLEKLQWGWGDYVVFDGDIRDLPYVENVNNKAPVLAYEAGYFVEAGFLDQDWRPNRALELNRVRALRPEGARLIHVEALEPASDGARVRVTDEQGRGARQARVTLAWSPEGGTLSRPADGDGRAFFPAPDTPTVQDLTAAVVNVCVTAGTYDWRADRASRVVLARTGRPAIEALVQPERAETPTEGLVAFRVQVRNPSERPAQVTLTAPGGPGRVLPTEQTLSARAGGTAEARFVWDSRGLAPGDYRVEVGARVETGGARLARTAVLLASVRPEDAAPAARITRLGCPDRRSGEPFEVEAEIENRARDRPVQLDVNCVLLEVRRQLPTQSVALAAGGKAVVKWQPAPDTEPLPVGVHTVCVSLPEVPGVEARGSFVVR